MTSLKNKIRNFVRIEDGLVTVEWVALTAGMVVAAVAIAFIVMQNTAEEASLIGGNVKSTADKSFGTTAEEFKTKAGVQ
jgi:hypothetical protein